MNRKKFIQYLLSIFAAPIIVACNNEQKKTKAVNPKLAPKPLKVPVDKKTQLSKNVEFITIEDKRYTNLNQGFNKRIKKEPLIIALCYNEDGICEAVRYARKNKLKIAIKSGGHSFEGFSSNNGGLVINLSQLKKIEWGSDHTVTMQPGCLLEKIYNELLPKKRIIPAGSCATVSVSGLTLGGGYGFFSRKYGLTCDSLLELRMVDNKGEIRTSKEDKDLLWACKGAGNGNFGIISSFTFKSHAAPEKFTSTRLKAKIQDASKAKHLLQLWFKCSENMPDSCFSAFVLNGKSLTVLITDYENHNKIIKEKFTPLISECDKVTFGNPIPLAKALKIFYGIKHPIYFKNASCGLYRQFNDIEKFIERSLELVLTTPGMIYQVNTLGGKIASDEYKQNSAFAYRDYNYLSELQAYWEKESQEPHLIKTFNEVQSVFFEGGVKAQYINYPSLEFPDYMEAYYGKHSIKLKEIKQRYDPENIFGYEQGIKPSCI